VDHTLDFAQCQLENLADAYTLPCASRLSCGPVACCRSWHRSVAPAARLLPLQWIPPTTPTPELEKRRRRCLWCSWFVFPRASMLHHASTEQWAC
jgi:hypothetical protein